MAFPDFMCIGAERAGTSWLYVNLRSHPGIWLPPIKEIRFFNSRKRRTGQYYRRKANTRRQLLLRFRDYWRSLRPGGTSLLTPANLRWDLMYFFKRRDLAWYQTLFEGHAGQIKGDITPSYCALPPQQIALIQECNPQLKIIFIMRDPIERSWSSATHAFRRWRNQPAGLSRTELLAFVNQPSERKQNDYLQTLLKWQEYFPPEQVFAGFTEEIEQSPRGMLLRIFGFLGVEPSPDLISPQAERKVNTAEKYKSAIPAEFQYLLANELEQPTRALAGKLGGYPVEWLRRIEAIRENPPASSVAQH